MTAQTIYGYFKNFCLPLFSSLLLVLSFPTYDLGILAWAGLVPLLVAINGKSLKYGFFLSLVSGTLFFLGIFRWILVIPNYTLLHHCLLAIYLGSYFGLFGLALNFISKFWGTTPALFAAPFIWVSLEYIRSNLSFLALPWALLSHSQYKYPMIIQIASLTGTYGISFLIVLVNAALATLFIGRLKSPLPQKIPPNLPLSKGGGKTNKPLLFVTAPLVIFTLLYGTFVISQPITGKGIKVSLVQGNIEQARKWDPRYAKEIIETYSELTLKASEDRPALIIWPETATPGAISLDPKLYTEIKDISRMAGAYLLLGSAQPQKFDVARGTGVDYSNSAYLIQPNPGMMKNQKYDKIRLFPFGEYLPYKEIIPWSLIKVRESSHYIPGKEFTVFELSPLRFGVTICWENVFPDLFRQFVKKGAQFMINITNEARFGKTAASYQLASISVFRAVENRVFVIRCANTGISCVIDPYGKVLDRVKDGNGQDIFVRGIMNRSIIPLESKTLYTQYGDMIVWVTFIGTGLFLFLGFRQQRKK